MSALKSSKYSQCCLYIALHDCQCFYSCCHALAPPTLKSHWPNIESFLIGCYLVAFWYFGLSNRCCIFTLWMTFMCGRRIINTIPDDKFHWSTRLWLIYLFPWVVYLHLWDVAWFEMQVISPMCVFRSAGFISVSKLADWDSSVNEFVLFL